ncbi:MAG: RluA family pseudouridine synthase, partial [Leptospirales bacterium]
MSERTIENDFQCETHEDRVRLDQILARRYPRFNRSEWQDRIRNGDVLVNDAPARPSRKVATGDVVRFRFQRGPEPGVSRDYRVIHEDEFLYVVDKPGDLPVHPSGVYSANTLYSLIKAERGPDFPVNLVHRLDRETSGLMVIAKDSPTARDLQAAFQAKDEVRKIYRTLVECPAAGFPERLDARGWIFSAREGPVRKK